jgi:hypothetical protein
VEHFVSADIIIIIIIIIAKVFIVP